MVAAVHVHCVDHKSEVSVADRDDELKEVPCAIQAENEKAVRAPLVLGRVRGDRVTNDMFDVLVGDAALSSRRVDPHIPNSVLRKAASLRQVWDEIVETERGAGRHAPAPAVRSQRERFRYAARTACQPSTLSHLTTFAASCW